MTNTNFSAEPVQEFQLGNSEFKAIAEALRRETGIFLSDSKKQLVYSRLSKRLRVLKIGGFAEYCELLGADEAGDELRFLTKALTTNVTSFYREPHHFKILREKTLPELTDRAIRGESIRIWSAGCSGGQEPYTIAMEVLEWLPDAPQLDVKILATDIDANMVEKGRRGIYTKDDVDGIDPELRQKYFQPIADGEKWQVSEDLGRVVTFRELNLFKHWPMQKPFDVIFCRNVFIYFEVEDQIRLWERYAENMSPAGWLFIGHSERLSGAVAEKFITCGITTHRLAPKAMQ